MTNPFNACKRGFGNPPSRRRLDEQVAKKQLAVEHWVRDVSWQEALALLMSRPTVNIEGLVGGYTGPGGKAILPHKAVAKLDLPLVPDMKAAEALSALKVHLAKRSFGDIEVNMTKGYDPNSTPVGAALIRAMTAVYKRDGIDPIMLPRSAGSWPGCVFTGEPLHLAAGHFGLGHGTSWGVQAETQTSLRPVLASAALQADQSSRVKRCDLGHHRIRKSTPESRREG